MKKILLIILTFFYLGTSTGFTMHLHYCMEKLVDTSLWHGQDDACEVCGMTKKSKKKNDCCKDEHKQVKLDKVHKSSENTFLEFQKISFLLPKIPNDISDYLIIPSVTEENPVSNSPPAAIKTPLYLKNQVFRI
ncbi:hypothetical protein H8S90_01475 [Olivibacter sp. SDN3]|uniref:Uncharacterized protein n=1 Tax=Sphingobacterium sp. (strain 21) TaxID=743722 RepID=F4C322_SPHS2|nr:hypothetical protein [Olivibacter sp. SDN3]MDX3916875.1 hypothetical protein [Pseudosphingobacterium sp.]QNL50329.1 hypothetical protein H8S90_01475 [Olivibacter sp. SDN3]